MLCTALSVPGLGPPDPGLVSSALSQQQQLLLADAPEPQVPVSLLGNIFPGYMELHVGLAAPPSDVLELQEWAVVGSWGRKMHLSQSCVRPCCQPVGRECELA